MCQGPVKEFGFCMKLKFAEKDEAKVRSRRTRCTVRSETQPKRVQDMLRELIKEEKSPTIGHIWSAREHAPSARPQSTAEAHKAR